MSAETPGNPHRNARQTEKKCSITGEQSGRIEEEQAALTN
jgi:hypothetical protein